MSVIKLSSPPTHEFWEIPILHEDEHLLALNKPPGVLTSPDRYDFARPSLVKLMHEAIAAGKPWAAQRGLQYLMNVHRLDFETSGVLLLAKNRPALLALADAFGTNQPVSHYLALVNGTPAEPTFKADAALSPHPTRRGLMRIDHRGGKQAETEFTVIEKFSGCTMLRCRPLTHRPHQIRAHLQYLRLPVLGDRPYGGRLLLLSRLKRGYRLHPDREERPLLDLAAVHHEKLEFVHPVTGAALTIEAPWPKDLTVAVKYLRRYAVPGADASLGDDQHEVG